MLRGLKSVYTVTIQRQNAGPLMYIGRSEGNRKVKVRVKHVMSNKQSRGN